MAIFDVAQVTRRGIDFIIVPLHANFEFKSQQEKYAAVTRLQLAADYAGLRGIVVPVWASRERQDEESRASSIPRHSPQHRS